MSFRKSVPFVEAFQQTECGLSCVCMMLRYYKSHVTLKELREYLEIGRDGSTLKQLNSLMNKFNLDTKIYKCSTENLEKIQLPAILYCGNNHFVILERMTKKYAYIIDPAYGGYKLEKPELSEFFSGFAISSYPNEKFIPQKQDYATWKYFIPILLQKRTLFIKIILLSLITYLLTLAMPIFIQNLIDNIKSIKDIKYISNYFLILVIFSIVYIIFYYLKGTSLVKLKVYVDEALSSNLFSHLLNVPYKFFDVRNKYDLIYSLNSSMVLRETFANQMIKGIIDLGAVCFIVIYMLHQSVVLACTSIVLFIINLVMVFLVQRYVTEYSKYLIAKQGEVQGTQVEAIFSILSIKMSAIEDDVYGNWYKKYRDYINKYYNKEKISNFLDTLMSFIHVISPLVVLSVSTYLVVKSQLTTGQMIAFFSLSSTFFSLANSIFNTWVNFINSSLYLERISDIVLSQKENETQGLIQKSINGNIKLENISFSYTKLSKQVIRNISLEIKSGDKVAIVGKSGCGKSTLAKLLVGLYKPTEGNIYYDDIILDQLDTKNLRRQIGIVPQDIMLFNKSILDNISMDREEVTLEEVEKACKIAQISEDIQNLPMGYHTIVSEMGMNFSGGQRQRIALARAIINEPKIIILDEATSSLDNVNEKIVTEYLRDIGCTRIIIAHRLSTVIDSDVIFVIDNGELIESGTHDQLMKNNGEYARLYEANWNNSELVAIE
ncbi:MAG: apxIB [Anaerocolumna sp.]|jgi:ABC-type bacteriocin/lantibiotic exporter with double-glycine peptidase domain|nr:apxIB [Anaerocolumna sp.]